MRHFQPFSTSSTKPPNHWLLSSSRQLGPSKLELPLAQLPLPVLSANNWLPGGPFGPIRRGKGRAAIRITTLGGDICCKLSSQQSATLCNFVSFSHCLRLVLRCVWLQNDARFSGFVVAKYAPKSMAGKMGRRQLFAGHFSPSQKERPSRLGAANCSYLLHQSRSQTAASHRLQLVTDCAHRQTEIAEIAPLCLPAARLLGRQTSAPKRRRAAQPWPFPLVHSAGQRPTFRVESRADFLSGRAPSWLAERSGRKRQSDRKRRQRYGESGGELSVKGNESIGKIREWQRLPRFSRMKWSRRVAFWGWRLTH